MAALSRLDLGPNLRTWLGPGFFSTLLAPRIGMAGAASRAEPSPPEAIPRERALRVLSSRASTADAERSGWVSSQLPSATRIYGNHHLDSTRWDVYEPRACDIIVSTSYKCGTTWAQQILSWLLRDEAAAGLSVNEVSPWVDACFMGVEKDELRERLAALPDRRFLKSHLPLDGLPYYPEVHYLIVGRDPRDVFMSLHNHYRNYTDLIFGVMNDPERLVGEPLAACPEDPRALWRDWISRGSFEWESEGFPFWANMGHTQSYWEHRALPNFLFLHYSDMLADLDGAVRKIVDFAGIDASEARIRRTVEETTFARVKERADALPEDEDPSRIAFRGGAGAFFYKGVNGRWREVLTEDDLALYEAAKARVLSPDCAAWLEHGGPIPA
jgi:aryl sulfotransferase